MITTGALELVTKVAFESHHEGVSVSGVIKERSAPKITSLVLKLGASVGAASGTGRVPGEITVAASTVGN